VEAQYWGNPEVAQLEGTLAVIVVSKRMWIFVAIAKSGFFNASKRRNIA